MLRNIKKMGILGVVVLGSCNSAYRPKNAIEEIVQERVVAKGVVLSKTDRDYELYKVFSDKPDLLLNAHVDSIAVVDKVVIYARNQYYYLVNDSLSAELVKMERNKKLRLKPAALFVWQKDKE